MAPQYRQAADPLYTMSMGFAKVTAAAKGGDALKAQTQACCTACLNHKGCKVSAKPLRVFGAAAELPLLLS